MALEQKSDKIFIDFLTARDILMLKTKRSNGAPPSTAVPASQNTKRYVILTYKTEFEKVHFPLVLNWIVQPDPESLKRTFKRVKAEYEKVKTFDGDARSS